jgi:hypothetical protein
MLSNVNFCIDIDNVIASTDEIMRQVIKKFTGARVCLAYEHIKEFNYYECQDDEGNKITREEWRKIHDLFSEPRNLWLIQPVSGAIEGLQMLAERGTIHLVTSRLPKARRTTIEWLENHGFPPHDLHFLKHGEKHSSLRPFTAAVEDDYEQAAAFVTRGNTPCFLLKHPWNESKPFIDGLQWVDTWPELTERLLELAL